MKILKAILLISVTHILSVSCSDAQNQTAARGVTDAGISAAKSLQMNPDLEALVERFYQPSETDRERLAGMSRAAFQARADRARVYINQLQSTIDYDELNIPDQVDFDYFQAQLDNSIHRIEGLRWWEINPSIYLPFDEFYLPSLDQTRPWDDRIRDMIPGFYEGIEKFAWGKENLKNPRLLWVQQAIEYCDRIVQYLDYWVPRIAKETQSESLSDELRAAAEDFRPHLLGYRKFLTTLARDHATTGDVRVPEEDYQRLLQNNFLDYTPDELLAIGHRVHEETRRHLQETAQKIDPSKTWLEIHQENSLNFAPPWELHQWLQEQANRARNLVYQEVVNVPPGIEEEYRYTEAGHFRNLFRMGFGTGSPPFIGEKYIHYYDLPTTVQFDHWDRKAGFMMDWSKGMVIAQQIPHEVYPGHHFQAYMKRTGNNRTVRARTRNPVFAEGWGVYSEDVMFALNYHEGDLRYELAHYQNRFWRTGRIVVDVSYHTGRMNYQDVVDFFLDAGLPLEGAEFEARVVSMTPTRELSYYVGKMEIEKLVADLKDALGEEFDLKQVHTDLLRLGGTPPKLARKEMFDLYGLRLK